MVDRNKMTECYSCTHRHNIPGNAHSQCTKPDPSMTGNIHGIKNGWFYYPINFDPTWKEKLCNNYQQKEPNQ